MCAFRSSVIEIVCCHTTTKSTTTVVTTTAATFLQDISGQIDNECFVVQKNCRVAGLIGTGQRHVVDCGKCSNVTFQFNNSTI